jgi:deoxycytidine triphosphate deaminase/plasmid maintenance system antidote protein VapI
MGMLGLSAGALADQLDVHAQTIYNATAQKRQISPGFALKLAGYFEEPAEFWLAPNPPEAGNARPEADLWAAMGASHEPGQADAGSFYDRRRPDSVLIDEEIRQLVEGVGGVDIRPFKPEHLESVSYDLTIGLIVERGFNILTEEEWGLAMEREARGEADKSQDMKRIARTLAKHEKSVACTREFWLPPKESVTIVSREALIFDGLHFADVGAMAENAKRGLLVSHGFQVDPGYRGYIFVTVMNISSETINLSVGKKLVSLAIRRLRRQPRKVYQDNVDRLIRKIFGDLHRKLAGHFEYSPIPDEGEMARLKHGFDKTVIGEDRDDVTLKAVGWLLDELANGAGESAKVAADLAAASLRFVVIERPEAEALIARFEPAEAAAAEARKHFGSAGEKQALYDTVMRMGIDPSRFVTELTGSGA